MTRDTQKKHERKIAEGCLPYLGIVGHLTDGNEPPDFYIANKEISLELVSFVPEMPKPGQNMVEMEKCNNGFKSRMAQELRNKFHGYYFDIFIEYKNQIPIKRSLWDSEINRAIYFIENYIKETNPIKTFGYDSEYIKLSFSLSGNETFIDTNFVPFSALATEDILCKTVKRKTCNNYRDLYIEKLLIIHSAPDDMQMSSIFMVNIPVNLNDYRKLNEILEQSGYDRVILFASNAICSWRRSSQEGWKDIKRI